MREFPGLLPWHFGGDPYLTYRESRVIIDDYQEAIKQRKKEAAQARKSSGSKRR